MSDRIKDGGPAFPVPDSHHANGQVQYGANGMTLRDAFAAKALNGWISGPCSGNALDEYEGDEGLFKEHQIEVAKACYGYADAMLAQREKGAKC